MSRKRWYGLTKNDSVYLEHILDEIAFLTNHVERLRFEDLLEDELLQRGVIRSLEIIGEASKNISPQLKEAYPQIQWKMMAAMRDKLIHRYFQVNWRGFRKTYLIIMFIYYYYHIIYYEDPHRLLHLAGI
jgi:uncharacterized protein with HEPN domain